MMAKMKTMNEEALIKESNVIPVKQMEKKQKIKSEIKGLQEDSESSIDKSLPTKTFKGLLHDI